MAFELHFGIHIMDLVGFSVDNAATNAQVHPYDAVSPTSAVAAVLRERLKLQ
jgi:hypothetical protein